MPSSTIVSMIFSRDESRPIAVGSTIGSVSAFTETAVNNPKTTVVTAGSRDHWLANKPNPKVTSGPITAYQGQAMFGSDGMVWIPRLREPGKPPLYDIVNASGRLVERVELPARTKLVGFGKGTIYLVRLDQDDLQYLQRHVIPTTDRP